MDPLASIVRDYFDGRHAQALQAIEPHARRAPDDPAVLTLHGVILAANRRTDEAIGCFRRLTELQPDQPEHWLNLGNALRESGQLQAGIDALETALARGAEGFDLDVNLGLAYLQAYRLQEACDRLEAAVRVQPAMAQLRIYLARVYSELDSREAALRMLDGVDIDGIDAPDELNHVGIILTQAGQSDRAEQALRRALRIDPGMHEAAQNLASMYERINRLDQARQALAGLPPHVVSAELSLIRARMAIRDRDYDAALANFEDAEAMPLDERLLIDLHFDRGKVHDRLGHHAAAMRDFHAAHEAAVALLHRQFPDLAAQTPADDWGMRADGFVASRTTLAPIDDGLPQDPVFVVGFPRSGTTLLEQLLNAHPSLQSMDEQLFVEAAIDEFCNAGHRYPEDLDALVGPLLTRVRRRYWDEVAKVVALAPGQRLVDKYPFNAVRLPFIARVFPSSRVVMLLRHPADACLSCYMQKFRLNIGTQHWASLESTTQLYARMMSTWLDHADATGFPVHTLRYEDLVADMPGRMRDLLGFLELPWDESVLAYADKARNRGRISTPSYAQVIEPISSRAIGRWRHYESHLAPYLPVLAPYIDRFGYAGDSPPAAGTQP